jgi:hypothetical protein
MSRLIACVLRKWADQDGGDGKLGTIIREGDGWARVKWDCGHENNYRIGQEDSFDLAYAEGELPKASSSRLLTPPARSSESPLASRASAHAASP